MSLKISALSSLAILALFSISGCNKTMPQKSEATPQPVKQATQPVQKSPPVVSPRFRSLRRGEVLA